MEAKVKADQGGESSNKIAILNLGFLIFVDASAANNNKTRACYYRKIHLADV